MVAKRCKCIGSNRRRKDAEAGHRKIELKRGGPREPRHEGVRKEHLLNVRTKKKKRIAETKEHVCPKRMQPPEIKEMQRRLRSKKSAKKEGSRTRSMEKKEQKRIRGGEKSQD